MNQRFEIDLFGNERPIRAERATAPVRLNLFDAAAESAALSSGRPRSQERAELFAGASANDWYCVDGGRIGPRADGKCDRCGK